MSAEAITLRTAGTADLEAIHRLLSGNYARLLKADYPPSVQVLAFPIIARANPRLILSGTYYVAETAEGHVVGAGGWSRSATGMRSADVRHVVTHRDHLRWGIARKIMTGIVSEARLAGMTRLDCLSTRTAVPFYRAVGFRGDREIVVGLRPGIDFPVIRMARTL
jgi:N-acetylglutamate synthase-like GNAT family acetyltransferase